MTKRKQTGSIKLLPLGGLGEIGMNCLVLETERDILVIDCGVMFGDLDPFGIDFIVPNLKYLEERREKVRAVVFTHGHEDHIGAFPFLLRAGIEVPAYASPFTSMMLESRLREAGLLDRTEIRRFKLGGDFRIGEFRIRTVPVNHSIVESVALCIDTPAGRIIHTGDFRIDSDPYFGNEMRFNEFKKWGEEGVLLLLSDSTNVERDTANDSERVIYDAFDSVLEESGGSTFFSMFSSNIGRMGQVFELARKHHKRVTVTGRSMQQNVELASKAGYFKDLNKILVPPEDIETVPRKRRVILSTGSQGEYRSALSKLAKAEHPFLEIQPEDAIVISSRFIPGNEKAVSRLINNLFRRGAHVHYEPCDHVHVSGHATRPELKKMIQAVKPKYFIPIHGEYRHLVLHAKHA
jgi:ribonuclease J